MACEELLQHPACTYKCVSASSTEPNVSVYISTKNIMERKKEWPNTQIPFVSVSLSVCMSLCRPIRKTWKEKRGPKGDGALFTSLLAPHRLGRWCQSWVCSHISCTRAPTCVELYVTLVGAVYYLSGSVPVCPPALHKPSNATVLRLWTAAQWKKEDEDVTGRKGNVQKRSDVGSLSVALLSGLGWWLSSTVTLDPYLYRCHHIPYMLHTAFGSNH